MTTLADTFFIGPSLFLQGNNVPLNCELGRNSARFVLRLWSCLPFSVWKKIDYCSIAPQMEHSLSFLKFYIKDSSP